MGHGGIFANAQTGNFVFMALAVSRGDWNRAGSYLTPICAFFVGALLVDALKGSSKIRGRGFHPARVVTGGEALVLLLLAFLPRTVPDGVFSLLVSFIAAMQFAAFGQVRSWKYTSIATTGNLRRLAGSLYSYVHSRFAREEAKSAAAFAVICGAFFAGLVMGAVGTNKFGNYASIIPALVSGILCLYLFIP